MAFPRVHLSFLGVSFGHFDQQLVVRLAFAAFLCSLFLWNCLLELERGNVEKAS